MAHVSKSLVLDEGCLILLLLNIGIEIQRPLTVVTDGEGHPQKIHFKDKV